MKVSTWSIRKIICIIFLILLFSNYGCESGDSTSKEAIDQIRKAFDAAWLSKDVDVIVAYCADDIILTPPNVGMVTGKEDFRNFLQGFFAMFTMTEIKTLEREVVVSGDLAFERILYEWMLVPDGGEEGIRDKINFIGIWQIQPDGAWKEIRAIWNSAKPIAGSQ
jgi:ketosteroid isomerase-like protein